MYWLEYDYDFSFGKHILTNKKRDCLGWTILSDMSLKLSQANSFSGGSKWTILFDFEQLVWVNHPKNHQTKKTNDLN